MAEKQNRINWIAIFAIVITLSLYLMTSLTSIKESVYKNTGNIQSIQTDMQWVKNAIQDAKDGDLSCNGPVASGCHNPVLSLFVK